MNSELTAEEIVDAAIYAMRQYGVDLDEGMSEDEIESIERRFNFAFGPDHRMLLRKGVPTGRPWLNWRTDSDDAIRSTLDWPIDGILFHVGTHDFRARSWGVRPSDEELAVQRARERLTTVPKLVPLFAHRFMMGPGFGAKTPVFSCHSSDVIIYGNDLLDYVHAELGDSYSEIKPRDDIPFWAQLAFSARDADL